MNISPTTRTIITYAIELNDDEVGEILADPSAFQKQLRAIRATQANGKHGAKNITIGSRKKLGGGGSPKGLACSECGKPFKNQAWLDRHMAKTHSVARDAKS